MNISTVSLAKRAVILLLVFLVGGCAATKTFHLQALAGDTVAVAVGWQEEWSRENIAVWVRPNGGVWTKYDANDPSIRAVINFYPDPLSSMVVSNRIGESVTNGAWGYGNNVNNLFTSGSRDWYQTVVFFDLPDTMALGPAEVYVEEVADFNNFVNTTVNIIGSAVDELGNPALGAAHDFEADVAGALQRQHLAALERSSHHVVELTGTGDVPHAVQLDFTHDTGVGTAYVVEPISGVKNLTWTDDGTNLRVIIMPADEENTLTSFQDFRFYVAGGVTNLTPSGAPQAFDINGGDVTGVAPPIVTTRSIVIDDTNI